MSGFKPNIEKQELIDRFGVTYGLPLFREASSKYQEVSNEYQETSSEYQEASIKKSLPNWIWDGSGIKADVYNGLKKHLSLSRIKVILALLKLGGSGTDEEIASTGNMERSSVNGRRNELVKLGVVVSYPGKVKIGKYGKPNIIWFLNYNRVKEIYKIERLEDWQD